MRQEFQVHILNAAGLEKANQIAEICSDALEKLETLVPVGRERALLVTKFQELAFFAKRGMAMDKANQQ